MSSAEAGVSPSISDSRTRPPAWYIQPRQMRHARERHSFPGIVSRHCDLRSAIRRRAARSCRITVVSVHRGDRRPDQDHRWRQRPYVVRRVLLRRNIVIDAETAQLVAAAVQAALRAGAPSRPPRRGRRGPLPTASRCSDSGSCPEREDETPLGWLVAAGLAAKRSPHTRAAYGRYAGVPSQAP